LAHGMPGVAARSRKGGLRWLAPTAAEPGRTLPAAQCSLQAPAEEAGNESSPAAPGAGRAAPRRPWRLLRADGPGSAAPRVVLMRWRREAVAPRPEPEPAPPGAQPKSHPKPAPGVAPKRAPGALPKSLPGARPKRLPRPDAGADIEMEDAETPAVGAAAPEPAAPPGPQPGPPGDAAEEAEEGPPAKIRRKRRGQGRRF